MADKPKTPLPLPPDDAGLGVPVTLGGDWDSELEAWEASFPVLAGGAAPSAESSSGSAGGSHGHATGPDDRRATHLFDSAPPPESPPEFPTPMLPEMNADAWAGDIHRLVHAEGDDEFATSDSEVAGVARVPRAPDVSYWEDFAELLADERRSASDDAPQAFELGLAEARVAEARGRPEEARTHLDTALGLPGLSSGSGQAIAAHRARLCLAERSGGWDDEAVQDSLHRLAFMPHPDQSMYRQLRAEWTLARAPLGEVDVTAAAQIAAIPEGLARSLAEAELVWHQPATAAAVLELAAHQAPRETSAAWLEVAAALNEGAGNFQAAVEQRGMQARLQPPADGQSPVDGRFAVASIRDIARAEFGGGIVAALATLLPQMAPGELKVAVARWGYRRARHDGDPSRGAAFIFAQDAELGPASAALRRDRADLETWQAVEPWQASPALQTSSSAAAVSPLPESAALGVVGDGGRALALEWPQPEARLCWLWQSCAAEVARAGASPALESMVSARFDELLGQPDHSRTAASSQGLEDVGALSVVVEAIAEAAAPDLDRQLEWLDRWARIDPARRAVALARAAEAIAQGRRAELDPRREEIWGEVERTAPTSMAAWRHAAYAAARGRFTDAAEGLLAMSRSPLWEGSPGGQALNELASERQARASLDPAVEQGRGETPAAASPLERNPDGGTGDGPVSPGAFAHALKTEAAAAERARIALGQPGPPGFWATVASIWAELAGEDREATRLAKVALAAAPDDAALAARHRRLVSMGDDDPVEAVRETELSTAETPAASLVEAAELAERRGNIAQAARLFQEAAASPDQARVAADALAGQFRCGAATLWPATPGVATKLSDAARALVDVDALVEAARADRWEDALGLLLDVPPHESEPSAQTWAVAAAVAAARLTDKPELAERLWTRAQALAIRPRGGVGQPMGEPAFDGAPLLALFRAADAGAEPDPVRRARAQEMLADLATAARPEPIGDADEVEVEVKVKEEVKVEVEVPGTSVSAGQGEVEGEGGREESGSGAAGGGDIDRDSAAIFMWLAAGADRFSGRVDSTGAPDADAAETERRLRKSADAPSGRAMPRPPPPFPAVMAWRRWLTRRGRTAEAVAAAAMEARAFVDRELRVAAWVRAAVLASAATGEAQRGAPSGSASARGALGPNRAEHYLREALSIAPEHEEAFSRMREIFTSEARHADLAWLLELRLAAIEKDGEEALRLRLALAECWAGPLPSPARAKEMLAAVLERDPSHRDALRRLAELEESTGDAAGAAAVLLRRAKVESSEVELCDIFLRLGRLYADALDDPKRSALAFHRVLEMDSANRESLERLSHLHAAMGDAHDALVVTETLAGLEPDMARRGQHMVTLGKLREQLGDTRGALGAFRSAVDLAPTAVTGMAELIRLLDKNRDSNGRRFALDGAVSRLRSVVRGEPGESAAIDALAAVMRWRERPAAAAALVEWSTWVTSMAPGAEGHRTGAAWAPSLGASAGQLAALARPEIEDVVFGDLVPSSFRRLFRSLGALLWEGEKRGVSSAGVDRGDRVAAGKPGREIWDETARALGAPPFDLYVIPPSARALAGSARLAQTARLAVLPGRPPSIVVGAEIARPVSRGSTASGLVPGRGLGDVEAGARFAAARSLYLLATGLEFAMAGDLPELATWLSAVIRQFIPDYLHEAATLDPTRERTARFSRLIPKKTKHDLMPFALECSGKLDLEALRAGIRDGINRVGLLASGHITAAVQVLVESHGGAPTLDSVTRSPECRRLLEFAMSDAYDPLLAALAPSGMVG